MKKLILLAFIGVALICGAAKAQTVTPIDSIAGSNNQDTFSYTITSDGWLNYSLIDNGGGGPSGQYESVLYIATEGVGGTVLFYLDQDGGGNIVGSVYIGTANISDLNISEDCGWIVGSNQCSAWNWDVSVNF